MLSFHIKRPEIQRKFNDIEELRQPQIYFKSGLMNFDRGKLSNSRTEFLKSLNLLLCLPKTYPNELITLYNNLAVLEYLQENFEKSKVYYKEAEARVAGLSELTDQHFNFLYLNLGLLHDSLGKYQEAMAYFELGLKASDPSNERNLSSIGMLKESMAITLNKECFIKEALKIQEEAMEIKGNIFGLNSDEYADSLNNYSLILYNNGDFEQAIKHLEAALNIKMNLARHEKRDLEIIYNNLGCIYYEKGNYRNSQENFEKMKEIIGEIPNGNLLHAHYFNNVGFRIMNSGKYIEGNEKMETALQIYKNKFGEEHPGVAKIYNNLSIGLTNRNYYKEANLMLEKALKIFTKTFPKRNLEIAKVYHNFGFINDRFSKHDEAFKNYFKALEIYKEIFGSKHPHLAIIFNNLGCSYSEKGKYIDALRYYKRSLDIKFDSIGARDIDIARTCRNFGRAFKEKRVYNEATKFFKRSFIIDCKTYGPSHPDVSYARNCIEYLEMEEAQHQSFFYELKY